VAFYFYLMAFHTRWLVFPSLIGFIVFCFQVHDQVMDHWLCLPYAIYIMVWACFLLAYWRQKSSVYAYRWGVLDYEVEECERPQFIGVDLYDDSANELRKVYPQWKRCLKYGLTIPVLSIISLAMLVIMATVFSTQDQLYYNYAHSEPLDYHPRFNVFIGVSGYSAVNAANVTNSTIATSQSQELRDPWGQHITESDLIDPVSSQDALSVRQSVRPRLISEGLRCCRHYCYSQYCPSIFCLHLLQPSLSLGACQWSKRSVLELIWSACTHSKYSGWNAIPTGIFGCL